jgi:hypothetical protein
LAVTDGAVTAGCYAAGVLIRPTSLTEILRTAREGLLMPPKSTFFTPKLLTGWVVRPTAPLPAAARGAGAGAGRTGPDGE